MLELIMEMAIRSLPEEKLDVYYQKAFYGACEGGHTLLACELFSRCGFGVTFITPEDRMGSDVRYNEVCKSLIKHNKDWNHVFFCAGSGGNKDLSKILCMKFEGDFKIFNMKNASREVLNGISILKGSYGNYGKKYGTFDHDQVDDVLCGASSNGHLNLMKWAIKGGASDFFGAIEAACFNGETKSIEYLHSMGYLKGLDISGITSDLIIDGNATMIKYLDEIGLVDNWDDVLTGSCGNADLSEIVSLAVERGANHCYACDSIDNHKVKK